MSECSAYRPDAGVCRNGFFQRFSCHQASQTDVPYCCRDELPEHWVNDDGSSKFSEDHPNGR